MGDFWDMNPDAALALPEDKEYLAEVYDILENKTFQLMNSFIHHGETTCLTHCLVVSYKSYVRCKKAGLNARAAARAGLLHDMFLYDWHTHAKKTGDHFHGYTHPRKALENAESEFKLTCMEKDIILKHMWPLTMQLPKSKEAFVVLWQDKLCSLRETAHIFSRLRKMPAK